MLCRRCRQCCCRPWLSTLALDLSAKVQVLSRGQGDQTHRCLDSAANAFCLSAFPIPFFLFGFLRAVRQGQEKFDSPDFCDWRGWHGCSTYGRQSNDATFITLRVSHCLKAFLETLKLDPPAMTLPNVQQGSMILPDAGNILKPLDA